MGNPQFRHIVSRQSYECEVPMKNSAPHSPLRESRRSVLRGSERVSEERLEEMEMRDLEGGPPKEFGNEDDEGVTA